MKAIETIYKGYRFRSRLEARWAVFFDNMGVPYEYEKEGFELDGEFETVRYLPDFWLPFTFEGSHPVGSGYWVEIKAMAPTNLEMEKIERLVFETNHNAYMLVGYPQYGKFQVYKWALQRSTDGSVRRFIDNGESDINLCFVLQWNWDADIDAALDAASQSRFEFGEKGR